MLMRNYCEVWLVLFYFDLLVDEFIWGTPLQYRRISDISVQNISLMVFFFLKSKNHAIHMKELEANGLIRNILCNGRG